MSWIEGVKEILRKQLKADKIRVIGPQEFEKCYLFVVEVQDEVFLIGAWRSERVLYAKITPATSVPMRWSCRDLEYTPIGLYAFAESPQELANHIVMKFPLVMNISKNIHLTVT